MPSPWLPETSEKGSIAVVSSIRSVVVEPRIDSGAVRHPPKTRSLIDYRATCLNANDFQRAAKKILSKQLYEYLSSGTDDEQTLIENQLAFKRYFLRPRVMRPVGNISTRTSIFGHTVNMPLFISPAGVHALCDPKDAECATARAAAKSGILFGLSVSPKGMKCRQKTEVGSILIDFFLNVESNILHEPLRRLQPRSHQLHFGFTRHIFSKTDPGHSNY